MHPRPTPTRLPRWGPRRRLRCSSLKYSRYSRSSRLAGGAPRPSRCDTRLSPRAARGVSPMMTVMRLLAAALLVVPVLAAERPRFAQWKSAELKQHEAALSRKVGPDHSARETLADYGDHRFRMLYRDADG